MNDFEEEKSKHKNTSTKRKREDVINVESKTKQMKIEEMFKTTKKIDIQQEFDEKLVNYVVCSMKPLSTVDDPNFRKLFEDIGSSVTIMSRRTISRKIENQTSSTVKQLIDTLQNIKYVCTTADIWSTKHRSFMRVTAHWIDENTFERVSATLACRRFQGVHSYDRVAEVLHGIHNEFGLTRHQLVSTISDNGSNFVKAFKEFGITAIMLDADSGNLAKDDIRLDLNNDDDAGNEENDDAFENDKLEFLSQDDQPIINDDEIDTNEDIFLPPHFRCASHTLSLLGTTDFKKCIEQLKGSALSRMHHSAFSKCNGLWNKSRQPKSAEIIYNEINCSLLYPCLTRWNSLFDSVQFLLKHKSKLNNIMKSLNLNNLFKETEFEYLEEFCLILKPLATALDRLQSEKSCFYGQLMPTITSMHKHITDLTTKNLKHSTPLVKLFIAASEKRLSKYLSYSPEINEAILASCFHPNFKLRWIPDDPIDSTNDLKKRIQEMCLTVASNFGKSMEIESPVVSDTDDDEFYHFSNTSKQAVSNINMEVEKKSNLKVLLFLNNKKKAWIYWKNIQQLKNYFCDIIQVFVRLHLLKDYFH